MGISKEYDDVKIGGEGRIERDARIAALRESGQATKTAPSDEHHNYVEGQMIEGRTLGKGSSGGSGARDASKKRGGSKLCRYEGCGLEAKVCDHAQRGRRLMDPADRKSEWLQCELPTELVEFLKKLKHRVDLSAAMEFFFARIDEGETIDIASWRERAWSARGRGNIRLRQRVRLALKTRILTSAPAFGKKRYPSYLVVGALSYYVNSLLSPNGNGD